MGRPKKTESSTTTNERASYVLTVRCTFTQPLLATNANNSEIYSEFLAKNAPDAETLEQEIQRLGLAQVDEKGMTVFLRKPENPEIPQMKAYTWSGFFKAKARALAKIKGTKTAEMKAYIKEIDDRISISPTFIDLAIPQGGEIGTLQRPLKAATLQGDRVSLAKSETVPIGTQCEFTVCCETKEGMQIVLEALEFGAKRGTGQWRNAGYGTFTFDVLELRKDVFKSEHQDAFDALEKL